MVTLAAGILTKRYVKKVPYMIAAMIVGSLVAEALNLWLGQGATGIKTVGALPAASAAAFGARLFARSACAMPSARRWSSPCWR